MEAGEAMLELIRREPNVCLVYLSAGINDLTVLQRRSQPWRVRIANTDPVDAARILIANCQDFIWRASVINPEVHVIVCPLYGMSMGKFNKLTQIHCMQPIINATVNMFNKY